MNTFLVRRAEPADIPEIQSLRLRVRENTLSDPSRVPAEMTLEAITRTGRGWVAVDQADLLGFSIALRNPPSIWALFVDPPHEGRGAGNALLERAVAWLFDDGAAEIVLSTDPGTRAETFYRRRGWIEAGKLDNGELRFVLNRPETAGDP